ASDQADSSRSRILRRMNKLLELPTGARRLLAFTAVLGAVALALRIPDLPHWNRWDLLTWVAITGASALAEQFTVEIHHQTENENFSLTDAIWVPALLLARPSVLTFAVLLGTLIGQSARRWTPFKIAYNTAQFLVAITAAEFVYGLFGPPSKLGLVAWLGGAMGMAAYFVL